MCRCICMHMYAHALGMWALQVCGHGILISDIPSCQYTLFFLETANTAGCSWGRFFAFCGQGNLRQLSGGLISFGTLFIS